MNIYIRLLLHSCKPWVGLEEARPKNKLRPNQIPHVHHVKCTLVSRNLFSRAQVRGPDDEPCHADSRVILWYLAHIKHS